MLLVPLSMYRRSVWKEDISLIKLYHNRPCLSATIVFVYDISHNPDTIKTVLECLMFCVSAHVWPSNMTMLNQAIWRMHVIFDITSFEML